MKRYFNLKSHNEIETIDQLNSKDFKTHSDFKKEIKHLLNEYHLAGINCYISQRPTKEWS